MSRPRCPALLLLVIPILAVTFGSGVVGFEGKEAKDAKEIVPDLPKLESGMTPEQVRELLGAPHRIARQILYHRYREQWIYNAPLSLRLTFECRRGQKSQLLSVPALSDDKVHSR